MESQSADKLAIDAPGAAPLSFQIAGAKAVSYESEVTAFADLAEGNGVRLDAVIGGYLAAAARMRAGDPVKIVGKPLFVEPVAIAIDKGDPVFGARIAEIVAAMRSDGTLRRLSLKWLEADVTTPTPGS